MMRGGKIIDKEGNILDDKMYEEVRAELRQREPFFDLLDEDWDTALPKAWEAIKELQEQMKKLNRHKHDDKTGDVMVRV